MIPITKMRQKTSARPSCGAIVSDFSRESDRVLWLSHTQRSTWGMVVASSTSTRAADPQWWISTRSDGSANERPQLGDVFFDPEAV
jgi:hypothetical protein